MTADEPDTTPKASNRPDDPRWHLHREVIRAEWVDYNDHLNVAFYVLIFDRATDAVLDRLGLGPDYRRRTDHSMFVADMHVTFEREVAEGADVTVASRVAGFDGKRLVLFHEMEDLDGRLLATNEVLCLHVDLARRRVAPLPADGVVAIEAAVHVHATLPAPPQAGRAIRVGVCATAS